MLRTLAVMVREPEGRLEIFRVSLESFSFQLSLSITLVGSRVSSTRRSITLWRKEGGRRPKLSDAGGGGVCMFLF